MKHKKWIVRYIFLFLSVALMTLIFWLSSQDSRESGAMSDGAASVLRDFFVLFFPEETADALLLYVRQYAHIFLYACLGVCVSICVFSFPCGHGWAYWVLPVLICLSYACTDEIHQLFVPGRSGKILDVGIDAIGFCVAAAVCNLIRLLRERSSRAGDRGGA